ncbi:MAG: cupin-like domain-containing protein [Pirellulaceae bacterium]
MIVKSQTLTQPLQHLNEGDFAENFNRRPFTIEHSLSDHPLFELDSLLQLSKDLPENQVEYNAGNLPVNQDPTKTPRNGLSIQETIQRISENKSWLVLKNVEHNSAYREVLDACLDQMQPIVDRVAPGMCCRQGFIFITSPHSITPYHIDPENNFLLQIRGLKHVKMFLPDDRDVLPETTIEAFFNGAHRNLTISDDHRERGFSFDLNPGDGLHFPVVAPHWVQNGPEVSVSFSITFQTDDSRRIQSLHRLNSKIRKFGIKPANVGTSPWRDRLKFGFCQLGRILKRSNPE